MLDGFVPSVIDSVQCFTDDPRLLRYHVAYHFLCNIIQTTQSRTTHGHMMPPQQHLYNKLARLRTISFLHGNGLACQRASPCWYGNGLARTDSVLVYGHRGQRAGLWPSCWLMASTGAVARDKHQDEQWHKIVG